MINIIAEGSICQLKSANRVTCGPRTALLPNGEIICTYMEQTKIGSNDFVPMASYSRDGLTWSIGKPIWPELIGIKSLFVSVRPTLDGRISLAGMQFNIDSANESFWLDEISGMKENELVFSISDDGNSFPLPQIIKLPFSGSAEQPGGMLIDQDGIQYMIYAPYPTITDFSAVLTNRLILIRSFDHGKTIIPTYFGIVNPPSAYAESWLVRLGNGLLMAATWQTANSTNPNQYFLSSDNGNTFSGPIYMPFRGQTTSLTPFRKDLVLVSYNQRKEYPAGVWLAIINPNQGVPDLLMNEPVWKAASTTRHDTTGDFSEWLDYAFGEPQVTELKDGTFLLVFWLDQPTEKGIHFIRFKLDYTI